LGEIFVKFVNQVDYCLGKFKIEKHVKRGYIKDDRQVAIPVETTIR
jgi:hypothetical protein